LYYILEQDMSNVIVGGIDEEETGFGLKYIRGAKLSEEERPRNLKIEIEVPVGTYPDFFEFGHTPIANQLFIDTLIDAGVSNFDSYQAPIFDPERKIEGYSIINFIGCVDCIDYDRSEYKEYKGQISRINNLSIDLTKTHDLKVFRPRNFELLLLVNADVYMSLKNLNGLVLSEAEGWNDRHLF